MDKDEEKMDTEAPKVYGDALWASSEPYDALKEQAACRAFYRNKNYKGDYYQIRDREKDKKGGTRKVGPALIYSAVEKGELSPEDAARQIGCKIESLKIVMRDLGYDWPGDKEKVDYLLTLVYKRMLDAKSASEEAEMPLGKFLSLLKAKYPDTAD